jgi:hypothetical protein
MVKTCTGCYKELAATTDNFCIYQFGKFGLYAKCKKCKCKYEKKYQQENKIKLAEYQKKHYQENKIRISEYAKKYRQENKIRITENAKKYRKEDTENLNLSYLKRLLKRQGFSTEQITPEIIELKLILIKTTRL